MATNKTAYQIARELIKAKEEIKRLKGEQDNQPNKSKEFFHG